MRAKRFAAWAGTLSLVAGVGLAAEYEGPTTLSASNILPARILKGPHYTIAEEVKVEGAYQEFRINTDYGVMQAEGRSLLNTRLAEIDALARLSEVSKTEVFVGAAGGAVLNVGKGLANVAKDPVGTAKGIGGGVKRFGMKLGRRAKRATERSGDSVEKPDPNASTTAQKTADAAANALGVGAAARGWARKLGVDPYTTNAVLHAALVDVGKIDTTGRILTKIVVPIPSVVSATATAGDLVWSLDAEDLRMRNEGKLAALGASKDLVARFFRNRNYTPSGQTRLIQALSTAAAKGCADYVETAAEAAEEREALFFVESAEMLAELHKTEPVTEILQDSRALVARTGETAVALLPFDTLRWTERLAADSREIAARTRQELGAAFLEVRIAGTATAGAKEGLGKSGWRVKEGVTAGLAMPPAQ